MEESVITMNKLLALLLFDVKKRLAFDFSQTKKETNKLL